ncbi:MAG: hypothetical protein RIQ33_199 [Bacteroidota bacterium]|jgi:protoheme ferro-lyase
MKKKLLLSSLLACLFFTKNTFAQWSELDVQSELHANAKIVSLCTNTTGLVYAAGDFLNDSLKNYVAVWNGNTWAELGTGVNSLKANNSIYSICIDGAGNVYAAGAFTNSIGNRYVAKWNGTIWSELGGLNALSANNTIYTINADIAGNVYAAGPFTNGSGNRYVAKYNGTSWSELGGLNTLAANLDIHSICSDPSGNIYATGNFDNGSGNKYVAIYNGTAWSELGGLNALAANSWIVSICADPTGNIYAAGGFTNGSSNRYVAKYNGTTWSELGGTNALAANNTIYSITSDAAGKIYAGGDFTNGSGKRYVAKFSGSFWSELGQFTNNTLSANADISSVCADNNGYIYTGGNFTNAQSKNYVAQWKTGINWSELGKPVGYNNQIRALHKDAAGNIYTAGYFKNTSNKRYVAKWDGSAWSELGGNNSLAANNNIFAITSDAAGNIYAAGAFTNSSGNVYVAKWNGTIWSELGGLNGLAANGQINSIMSDATGNIYATGAFVNGSGSTYVAIWNGTTWIELGGNNSLAANSIIYCMNKDASGNIYVAGDFVNSSFNYYVAKYNGTSWSELGGNNSLAANNNIGSISTDAAGNVYAMGFTNGSGNYYVAKYNGTTWSETGGTNSLSTFVNNPNMTVHAMCSDASNNIYLSIGKVIGLTGRYYIAKYDGINWSELGGVNSFAADSFINTLTSDATGNIYTAGEFKNSSSRNYVAKFDNCTPTATTFTTSACDSFIWVQKANKKYFSSNTTDTIKLMNAAGCDSIVTLNLTIKISTTATFTTAACDSFIWVQKANKKYFSSNNTDTIKLMNAAGCDSIVTLNLTIKISTASTFTTSACDSFIWVQKANKKYFSSNNTDAIKLMNAAGCDSIVTLNLTIKISTASTFTTAACDSFIWVQKANKKYFSSNTTDTIKLMNAAGCDSIVTLNLTIKISTAATFTTSACDSFIWVQKANKKYFSSNTTDTIKLMNAAGCDSIVTLNLTINHATSSTSNLTICSTQLPYSWNGLTFTSAGTQTKTGLTNVAGCDSSATLNLTIGQAFTVHLGSDTTLCKNQIYTLDGTVAGISGATYNWFSTSGFTNSNASVNLSVADKYWLKVTDNSGCTAADTFQLSFNNTPIDAEIFAATQLFTNDTVTFVNISQFTYDTSFWNVASNPNISIISSSRYYLEIAFKDTGLYNIGLTTLVGSCSAYANKSVNVLDGQNFPKIKANAPFILEYKAAPNPSSGSFTINVKLAAASKIRLRLLNLKNDLIESDVQDSGLKEYAIPFNLTLSSGMYVMILETQNGMAVHKIIIN